MWSRLAAQVPSERTSQLQEFWKGSIFMLLLSIQFSIMESKKLYHFLTLVVARNRHGGPILE